jgi:lantibiotic modifying enzyme
MKPTLGEFVCDDVIGNALTASWNNQPSGNHCLCHGSFGNAEIFRSSGDPERAADLVASAVADYRKNKQWFCGMPGGEEVPGLMCGTSGIGYGLLRHAFADRLPNLLTLDVPYFNQP